MWVRLDDGMAHHPKFVRSGPEALALFVAGLCYCNRYQTDGLIPKLVLPSLLPGLSEHRAIELALRLATNAARPSWIDVGDHFRVHDFEDYQPLRAEVRREASRDHGAASEGGGWDDATRDMTGYVTRDGDAEEEQITRYRKAPERYCNAPLPGPLPPSRPVPVKRELSTRPGWEGDWEQAKRAQNAQRQRRFRERHAVRGDGVMRYVTRYGNAPVTHNGNAYVPADHDPGTRPIISRNALSSALSLEERKKIRRAQNAERQRRFRCRRAARLGEAARGATHDRDGVGDPRGAPDGGGGARLGDTSVAGSVIPPGRDGFRSGEQRLPSAPVRSERDREAEFVVWFAGYPRQEAEIAARQAWMVEAELPPLVLLQERLAVQKVAKPDAYYWLLPDRYIREKRWRDQPPPAPVRGVQARSVWAQLRAMGSDEGRRQRLREISAEARFDPFDPRSSDG
jgi:hypothetical protein